MDSYFVHDLAVVDNGAVIGKDSKIWHFAHVRSGAKIGDNVIVGKSSYIDTGVIIGSNVKIQNLVSVYDGVEIENDVFVGPHVTFTNDLHPRSVGDWEITKTMIRKGASIGANATIICGILIGEYAMIGAGSVVTKDVANHGIVVGNPARQIGWVCYCGRKIANTSLSPGTHKITCQNCQQTVTLDIKENK